MARPDGSCRPDDPDSTAEALLNVLTDRVRARAFAAAARDRWARAFRAERMTAAFEQVWRSELELGALRRLAPRAPGIGTARAGGGSHGAPPRRPAPVPGRTRRTTGLTRSRSRGSTGGHPAGRA